jgi:DNA replication protein DnaC
MGAEEPSRGDKTFSRKPQTFENFEQVEGARKVFEAFYLVAHSLKPPFLLCYGGLGNGKTHLCRATAKVLNSKGIWARYITMSDLMAMLKDSIPENKTSEVVQGLSEQPALIIDDWGVEYGTDWELSKLEDIIDKRYDAELLTIITSNKDFPQLEQMSRRITSRFKDSLLSKLVLNDAPDYRPRKKKDHGAK